MKIAVITGASSGLGKEYALAVSRLRPDVDEIWLVARRKDKLEEVASNLSKKYRPFLDIFLAIPDSMAYTITVKKASEPRFIFLILATCQSFEEEST